MAYKKKRMLRKRPIRRKAKRSVKAVRRIVRKVLNNDAEVKCIQYVASANLVPSSPANSIPAGATNIIELGFDGVNVACNQGTGQGGRVGNKVRTKRIVMKGTLCPLEWNTTTNQNPRPIEIKMVIFYDKSDPNAVPNPFAGGTAGPFQGGNGVNVFTNYLSDMWMPFNADRYRICATRTFKVGYAAYTGTATTAGNQTANQAYTNNDFKLNHKFSIDVTKYYPKNVRFPDNSAIPTTRAIFAMFFMAAADGTNLPDVMRPIKMSYMQSVSYTDI